MKRRATIASLCAAMCVLACGQVSTTGSAGASDILSPFSKTVKVCEDGSSVSLVKSVSVDKENPEKTTLTWRAFLKKKGAEKEQEIWSSQETDTKGRLLGTSPEVIERVLYDAIVDEKSVSVLASEGGWLKLSVISLKEAKADRGNTVEIARVLGGVGRVPVRAMLLKSKERMHVWVEMGSNEVELYDTTNDKATKVWAVSPTPVKVIDLRPAGPK